MADDDIVVVFDDAAGEGGDTGTGDDKGGKAAAKVDGNDPDLVSDLRSQLSRMSTQTAHLSSRATAAEQEAERLRTTSRQSVQAARADTLDSGIAAAKSEGDAAEQAYQKAFEDGDAKAMAAAQRKMSSAEAKRVNLEQARASLDDLPTRRAPRAEADDRRPAPAAAAAPTDPFEAWAHNGGQPRSHETVEWARKHKSLVLDPVKMKKLTAAHYAAEAEDIEVDSPEYFRSIEKYMGIGGDADTGRREAPRQERRPGAPVLPAGDSGGGRGGREVKLTAGEKASATDGTLTWNYDDPKGKFKQGDPIGVQEFARRKLVMQEQGLYDKTLTAG